MGSRLLTTPVGNLLRRVVRGTPLLYRMHLRIRGANDVRVPRRGDVLHLTGFPRSANTQAMYLVQKAAPAFADRISTHNHVTASIRIALRAGVPTVVLIRDPLEAISSRMVMARASPTDDRSADHVLAYYRSYYAYVERRREDLEIVDFRTVIERPLAFLALLRSAAPGLEIADDRERVVEEVWRLHKHKNVERLPEDRTVPDPRKSRLKEDFRALLRSRPGWRQVEELYRRLSPVE